MNPGVSKTKSLKFEKGDVLNFSNVAIVQRLIRQHAQYRGQRMARGFRVRIFFFTYPP